MPHDNRKIDHEAAEWAVRMHARPITPDEQAALDHWLQESPSRIGALLRARATWTSIDRVAALAAGQPKLPAATPPSKSRAPVLAAAASLVLALAASAIWFLWPSGNHYSTPIGSLDRVQLADGSRVTLNTDTSIHVELEQKERRIQLDRGEALFEVAKDSLRPFVVQVGSISVRAVGTAFSVRALQGRVDVTVTEGVVELVDESASRSGVLRRVAANEHATIIEQRQVEVQKISVDATRQQLAWLDRMIDFDGQSLSAAVEEINRHNTRRVVIDDPAIAGRPVIGVFKANDPRGFAVTVATALGIEYVEGTDTIHLRARSAP